MVLDDEQKRRYARHIMLPDIGERGQQALCNASVLVVGAGGLGAPALSYLAAAGVGRLGVVDGDHVELSNLQRQIVHEEGDVGRLKVESAGDRISELHMQAQVDLYPRRLVEGNAPSIIRQYDIVIDGTDNFATRYLLNCVCYAEQKPLVSAAIKAFEGNLTLYTAYLGAPHPCYQCWVPEQPDEANNCTEAGVAGPLAGIMGSWQAQEALKWLTNAGENLSGTLMRLDTLRNRVSKSTLMRNPDCPVCGG